MKLVYPKNFTLTWDLGYVAKPNNLVYFYVRSEVEERAKKSVAAKDNPTYYISAANTNHTMLLEGLKRLLSSENKDLKFAGMETNHWIEDSVCGHINEAQRSMAAHRGLNFIFPMHGNNSVWGIRTTGHKPKQTGLPEDVLLFSFIECIERRLADCNINNIRGDRVQALIYNDIEEASRLHSRIRNVTIDIDSEIDDHSIVDVGIHISFVGVIGLVTAYVRYCKLHDGTVSWVTRDEDLQELYNNVYRSVLTRDKVNQLLNTVYTLPADDAIWCNEWGYRMPILFQPARRAGKAMREQNIAAAFYNHLRSLDERLLEHLLKRMW
jgi:hypothetical protein